MKKATIILLVFLCANVCFSQFSTSLSLKPSIPLSGVVLPGFTNIDKNGVEEAQVATMGAGLSGVLSFYYELNETFSIGIEGTYFTSFEGDIVKENTPATGAKTRTRFKSKATMISPFLLMNFGHGFYSRLGVVWGVNPQVKATTTVDNIGLSGERIDKYKDNGALGVQTGFGFEKDFSDKFSWFTEMSFLNLVHKPAILENTQNFDGIPLDPTISFEREVSLGEANTQLTFPIPFHNFGIAFGLKMKL